jgi:low affinity Fe/Cu permease
MWASSLSFAVWKVITNVGVAIVTATAIVIVRNGPQVLMSRLSRRR